jgi:DNA-binding PadR family transcriptional regulator
MSDPKKERYRQVRGAILNLLAHQHPAPLEIREILFLLDDLGLTTREEELKSHLSYLQEKGLIQMEERTAGGITREMVRITADGLNVLDKFTKDIGVNVEF